MKQTKTIFASALVLVSVGLTSMVVAEGTARDGKAIVRSMHGDVQYQVAGGEFKKLRTNMELTKDTVLKSAAGAEAYLQVNGFTSTVKLTESTEMTLEKMEQIGGFVGGDSTTDLKLASGTLLGSVRKISANSEYKVAVPNGVAGIRGTDFQVTVTYNGAGSFTVQFTSVTGQISCAVVNAPPGSQTTANLTTGQTWTVTGTVSTTGGVTTVSVGTVQTAPQNVIIVAQNGITQLQQVIIQSTTTAPPTTPPTQQPPSTTGGDSGSGSSTTTTPTTM
jgi:hypothetical protein